MVVDNRHGAYQAVRHLLRHGHRRIGYLGDREDIWAMRERYVGFAEALAADGLDPDPALVRHGLRGRAEAAAAAVALLRHPDPPTALFTSNDLITMGAIDGMHGSGRRQPGGAGRLRRVRAGRQADPAGDRGRPGPGGDRGHRRPAAVRPDRRRHLAARQVVLLTRLVARGSGEITPLGKPGMPA